MLVAARSDEHESRLRPSQGARPPRRGQWTAGARRSPIAFLTAVKVPNDRMRGSQFSSRYISLPYRRYGCASFLCMALANPTPDKRGIIGNWLRGTLYKLSVVSGDSFFQRRVFWISD